MFVWVLAALVAGSAVYCLLAIFAELGFLLTTRPGLSNAEPISVLRPLAGVDSGFEENLRSLFKQRYPHFELIFAVRDESDPAVPVLEQFRTLFPRIPAKLIVTGEPPYPNAKVWSLEKMTAAARHSLLVMTDSDIGLERDFLAEIAADFQDPKLGLMTCPYRAIPGKSIWSGLETLTANTEFLSGVLVARMIEGMRFAVGPTMAARKAAIEQAGGWANFRDYLAEDFMLGQAVAKAGAGVGLSRSVVGHSIAATERETFAQNAEHRLRWCRSTRRSRPAGYVGQLFTHTVPLAVLLALAAPAWWPLALAAVLLRFAAAVGCARILRDPLLKQAFYLLPLADFASFGFWIAGFFGNKVRWRDRIYLLHRDGRFERVAS
ncbi:MAG: bacteriohopanetetrol glucosamine biosynthesis glycosyltransferase HpnI [Bryobacteraceae bacterium]